MQRLELKTVAVREDGCFSVLLWDGRPIAVSVERTFDDERPILQNGVCDCNATVYMKGNYDTFEIMVPGHSRILFHKGNTELDSIGCVVVGSSFDAMGPVAGVLNSAAGFANFIALTKGLKSFQMLVSGR